MSTNRAPKWSKWRSVPAVKLWEGVALSLNIEPTKARRIVDFIDGAHPIDEGEEFNDRMFVVRRNSRALQFASLDIAFAYNSTVLLKPFVVWMKSIGWAIPPELSEMGDSVAGVQVARPADFGAWMRRDLWTLVEAAYVLSASEPMSADKPPVGGLPESYYRDLKDASTLQKIPTHGSRSGVVGGTLVRPSDCVTWASRRGIDVPVALKGMVAPSDDAPLHPKEKTTLLKLVIGLAVKGFDYDPAASRSDAPKEIAAALDGLGIGLDVDTVRKWLHEGAALLPSAKGKSAR